jgi:hypothetical protein
MQQGVELLTLGDGMEEETTTDTDTDNDDFVEVTAAGDEAPARTPKHVMFAPQLAQVCIHPTSHTVSFETARARNASA